MADPVSQYFGYSTYSTDWNYRESIVQLRGEAVTLATAAQADALRQAEQEAFKGGHDRILADDDRASLGLLVTARSSGSPAKLVWTCILV